MQVGVAKIDITPPVGIDMTGFIAREGPSLGVLDPLFARALVIDDGTQKAAIITCDLLGLHWHFVKQVRSAINTATGIPAGNILITCSHTHAGPASMLLQECGEMDANYMARLQDAFVEVTWQACSNRQSAQMAVGHGQVTDHVHNRRTPGDVIDPDLAILQIIDEAAKPIAILLNYACHPTCLEANNRLFSAEYPGIAAQKVAEATGAVTFFITGSIGDVGPVSRGLETMQQIGATIGNEALRVLAEVQPVEPAKLIVKSATLALPLLPPPTLDEWQAEVKKWREMQSAPDIPLLPSHPKIPVAMRNWSSRMRDLAAAGQLPTQVSSEVQMILLGNVAFISLPGEFFVELGLAIKEALADYHLFLCGFGNDDIGYIPARRAYPKGGYEIAEAYKYYGYPTALAPEAGEQIVAMVLDMCR